MLSKILILAILFSACEELVKEEAKVELKNGETTTATDDEGGGSIDVDEDSLRYDGKENAALLEGAVLAVDIVPSGSLQLGDGALQLDGDSSNSDSGPYYGQSTTANLESLKYFITSIQICESIEISGTAFNNPKNCLQIFEHDAWKGKGGISYDDFGYDAAKASDAGYVDLMDKDSIKKLSQNLKLNENHLGKYNYGLVNWMQPVKFKTSITLSDNTVVYSKDHKPVWHTDSSGFSSWRNNPTSLTGPAEEAIVRHSNGGAWIKFAQPFEVTREDLENEEKFQLDLTFNPEALISATYQTPSSADADGPTDPNPGYKFDVPLLALTPIAHKLSDPVKVETYKFRFSGTNPAAAAQELADTEVDYRVELYYLENDSSKSVYGVNIQQLYTADTKSLDGLFFGQVFTVRDNDDGSLGLLDYEGNQMIDNFQRFDTVDDGGIATAKQGHQREFTLDLNYSLIRDELLRTSDSGFVEDATTPAE